MQRERDVTRTIRVTERQCACGAWFELRRPWALFCSSRCRQRAHRVRSRAKPAPKS